MAVAGSGRLASASYVILNGSLNASVAGNALTVSILAPSGLPPSPTEPLFTAFLTQLAGSTIVDASPVAAPLSITISSGSTLGTLSGVPFRLWVVLFNDHGTFRLGLQNSTDASGAVPRIYPLFDAITTFSIAEGGVGGADSAFNIYTTVAVTSALCRIVGVLEWSSGLATPGAWSSVPDLIKIYSAESNAPGSIAQEDFVEFSSASTTTTIIPLDNTTPQNTEGAQFQTRAFQAQSACNVLEIEIILNVSHSVASGVIAALFKDTAANAIACGWTQISAADAVGQISLKHRLIAGDISIHDYKLRAGPAVAGTMTVNGTAGAMKLNSTLISSMKIREFVG